MASRALLIGSQLAPLSGISNDLDLIGVALADWDFTDVRRHEGSTATRQEIIDAFVELVQDTATGDAVAVYYSGHGGVALNTANPVDPVQYLAPTDYPESVPGDFRGITHLELSMLIAALTRKTTNVSVLFDCCHSALMARAPGMAEKAIPASSYLDVAAHHARIGPYLLARGLDADPEGNERAVQLAACGQLQTTKEYETQGQRVGMFTRILCALLAEAGDAPLTWAGLVPSLRRRLRLISPQQQPQAAGPSSRLLFTDVDGDTTGVLGVERSPDGAVLDGGTLAGVALGDRFAAVPTGDANLARLIGRLTVESVTPTGALASVVLEPGQLELPRNANARPVSRAMRALPVLVAPEAALDAVRAAMTASRYVEALAQPRADEPVLATVELDSDRFVLRDATGPIVEPVLADDAGAGLLVRNLDRLARAAAVRALDNGDEGMRAALEVTWGTVKDGVLTDRPLSGGTLFVGDPVFVRLRNVDQRPLHAFVFAVDAGGAVSLLTRNNPLGVRLVPTQERVVGRNLDGAVTGLPLGWPDEVPPDVPRPESLLVIATRSAIDLRMLAQEGVQGPLRAGATPLEEAIYQIVAGGSRAERGADASAAVWHLDYLLVPGARPAAATGDFLDDERPDLSVALLAARTRSAEPVELDVVLAELRVRPEHPLHGPDLRLDVLVCSGPAALGDPPRSTAVTIRLPAPQPGADLVLVDQPVLAGPTHDYLAVAIWLARDPDGAPGLDALLPAPAGIVAGADTDVAVAQLAAVEGRVDAAATTLAGAVHDVTGLYRGSFAADAAVGPHPVGQLGTEQRIELRFRVDAG